MDYTTLSKEEVQKAGNMLWRADRLVNFPSGNDYKTSLIIVHDNICNTYKDFPYEIAKENFDEVIEKVRSGTLVYEEPPVQEDLEVEKEDEDYECISEPIIPSSLKSIDDFSIKACFMGDAPKTKWLVDNLIEHNTITSLVAAGGVGKTYLALDLSLKLSAGANSKFLDFTIDKQCLVFFVTVEDGRSTIQQRLEKLDPDKSIRKLAEDTFYGLTATEAFGGHFTLVEYGSNQNTKLTANYKWLIEEIKKKSEEHPDLPIFVVFDTYSATHHSDENNAAGAKEWFRAASVLQDKFEATILITHHIRKTGYQEPIRGPEDFEMTIRGSNVFVNTCRIVLGIWAMPQSEAQKITSLGNKIGYNFSLIKDNSGPTWGERDIGKFNRPTITLVKHEDGYLYFDPEINAERKNLCETKKALSEEDEKQLQEQLKAIIYFYADNGYPPSKSMFDKQEGYIKLLSVEYNKTPPRYVKVALKALLDEKQIEIAKIRINNKECEVYDRPNGAYVSGALDKRTATEMPSSPYHLTTDN